MEAMKSSTPSHLTPLAYDAMWTLAAALNKTETAVQSGDIGETGCQGLSGSLVPLDQFNHTNALMGCLIRFNLQRTRFTGMSVSTYSSMQAFMHSYSIS